MLGHRPGKVFAVHLNYKSRAAQRGRTPEQASYFFKPASSLSGSGEVARPEGTELLGFEGEIAVVIGAPARNVSPEDGWSHIGWVTASNDLGLYDLRYADKGSNVRSKGGDGFTPLGPELLDARRVRPDGLRIRTWLDGELVQDDTTAELLFDFGHLVADLSRMSTLEAGDVILTGTPAGASVAEPGQVISVEVSSLDDEELSTGKLETRVVSGPPLGECGSPAKPDDAARADAYGTESGPAATSAAALRIETSATAAASPAATSAATTPATSPEAVAPAGLSATQRERLGKVAVATLSAQLRKRGYDTVSLDGVHPLTPGTTIIGTARTLRYVPFRKDLFAAKGGGHNAQKRAIDTVNEGEVLVMEARGHSEAGTLGDILAARAQLRGAAGIITDGAVRDAAAVADLGLPVYSSGRHPAVLGRRHVPWDTDITISCGGATVQPGDIIVGNDDGVLVIPPALLDEVLADSEQQEHEEAFILEQVQSGRSVDGLYPLTKESRAEYEDWAQRRGDRPQPLAESPSGNQS
ncbi:fumarylacetoacetate hydrolase family protein [Saxibacter everestensis]|uniref:Fumarylacetoacetate hydrolase family protein n=2 Tax=Saxibacter everestensis TaxID=2909229 RepID=A0ABY8QYP5_9MICO|nr:fumarylacetoacetate hydrolase family protein [Brevibacteriaceae bacterium ZFBP1038]